MATAVATRRKLTPGVECQGNQSRKDDAGHSMLGPIQCMEGRRPGHDARRHLAAIEHRLGQRNAASELARIKGPNEGNEGSFGRKKDHSRSQGNRERHADAHRTPHAHRNQINGRDDCRPRDQLNQVGIVTGMLNCQSGARPPAVRMLTTQRKALRQPWLGSWRGCVPPPRRTSVDRHLPSLGRSGLPGHRGTRNARVVAHPLYAKQD